jgi:hypothetical protein
MKIRFLCPACWKYGKHHELTEHELVMGLCTSCGMFFEEPLEVPEEA